MKTTEAFLPPVKDAPENQDLPPLKTILHRGWLKRCPRCGKGPMYERWLKLHEACPACGLKYLADQGDLLGPLVFIDRLFFLIPLVTLFCFILPHAKPWLYISCSALAAGVLLLTMPNRNGVSLAFDYYVRCREQNQALPVSPPPDTPGAREEESL